VKEAARTSTNTLIWKPLLKRWGHISLQHEEYRCKYNSRQALELVELEVMVVLVVSGVAKEAKEAREAMAREEVSNRPHSPNRHRQGTEFLGDCKEVHKLWKTHLLWPRPSMEHMDHLCAFRSIPCKLRKCQ